MRKFTSIAISAAALGIAAVATPAQAAITLCSNGAGCLSGTTNVNLNAYPDTGSASVTGTVGIGGPLVTFTSTDGLLDTNPGAATVFRAGFSPNSGPLLTQLTFTVAGGFTAAEFNLENGSPRSFIVTLIDTFDVATQITLTNANGSNIFNITGNSPGQVFTSASFSTTDGAGFNDLKQLRLVLAPGAVPEPGTWALMLLGFGGMGMAMRRSRRQAMLQQMA
ncbi:PEPxxWA-CTERM sorting domain-containing protein [Sphingomonas sp. KRR8]|uniref:PEPxxWA-CTERM sorting domain-containing protein n=1 Tax=Sphingomonas sp. KRR8 TaxID=2942996 RepID=UPI00202193DC|nr:PEPxxWA-CTERM sorting domain-containing protein [Sphingomonas sp. KRR8]URD60423.1 PEPxxWA-CTERM sorting domain-containing protein [Sphingomonas sp. KRR8]